MGDLKVIFSGLLDILIRQMHTVHHQYVGSADSHVNHGVDIPQTVDALGCLPVKLCLRDMYGNA